jgi:hypothetical protein
MLPFASILPDLRDGENRCGEAGRTDSGRAVEDSVRRAGHGEPGQDGRWRARPSRRLSGAGAAVCDRLPVKGEGGREKNGGGAHFLRVDPPQRHANSWSLGRRKLGGVTAGPGMEPAATPCVTARRHPEFRGRRSSARWSNGRWSIVRWSNERCSTAHWSNERWSSGRWSNERWPNEPMQDALTTSQGCREPRDWRRNTTAV